MSLQRRIKRVSTKFSVFFMSQFLNFSRETIKLFFKTRGKYNFLDRPLHALIRSFKLFRTRSLPCRFSCSITRTASDASFSSHCRRISLSNSFGSTTTSLREDAPRSRIFLGISIVMVGIYLCYHKCLTKRNAQTLYWLRPCDGRPRAS